MYFSFLCCNSEIDIVLWLSGQVDMSKEFKICVTRENILQRGRIQWQRQKKSSPANKLSVTFIGEAGVDTGALTKEFLTGNMRHSQYLSNAHTLSISLSLSSIYFPLSLSIYLFISIYLLLTIYIYLYISLYLFISVYLSPSLSL